MTNSVPLYVSTLLKLQPNTAWCCHKRHSLCLLWQYQAAFGSGETQIFLMNHPSLNETLWRIKEQCRVYPLVSYSACPTHPAQTSLLRLDVISRNDAHQQEESQNGGAVFSSLHKQTFLERDTTLLDLTEPEREQETDTKTKKPRAFMTAVLLASCPDFHFLFLSSLCPTFTCMNFQIHPRQSIYMVNET